MWPPRADSTAREMPDDHGRDWTKMETTATSVKHLFPEESYMPQLPARLHPAGKDSEVPTRRHLSQLTEGGILLRYLIPGSRQTLYLPGQPPQKTRSM